MTRKSSSVTIRDVARYAGVSVATVSRYINQNAPVSRDASERISQVMMDLSYSPHATARNLATHRTLAIGLLVPNVDNDIFGPLFRSIEGVLRHEKYILLVATYNPAIWHEVQMPVGPHNTDGLMVFADALRDEQLAQLAQANFPLVVMHRTPDPTLNVPFVTVENELATRKLIDHLIEAHGRRRILFIRGPRTQEDARLRERGYRASLTAHGLPIDESLFLDGDFATETVRRLLVAYLADGKRNFDAIFAGNDLGAIGVLDVLRENGLRVPEDVAVVGFDDSRLARFQTPPLSTVRAPTEDVGRMAALQLVNLVREQPVEQATLLPTQIVLRRSCGCSYDPHSLPARS